MKKLITSALVIICLPFVLEAQFRGEKAVVRTEFIYQKNDVPFPSCHASTIIENANGLLAAWFGGTEERNPDVGIWISHYTSGKWSVPVELANGIQHKSKRYPCWNPVLYNTGKQILLFYKTGPSPSTWWGELKNSEDNGLTWLVTRRLPEGIYGPIKNKPVILANGVLLCPSSTEDEGWRVHMEMTSDNGLTWERTLALNDKQMGAIQPTILLHKDGKIQMLCRSKTTGKILSSFSSDNGYTWSGLSPITLPNPNSGIDAVTLKDGRHILIYNHILKGRNVLNAAISDDGLTWKAAVLLENESDKSEFSYPAVIQTSDGLVHITYTWNRKLIKHVVIDPLKISAKAFENGNWPLE